MFKSIKTLFVCAGLLAGLMTTSPVLAAKLLRQQGRLQRPLRPRRLWPPRLPQRQSPLPKKTPTA